MQIIGIIAIIDHTNEYRNTFSFLDFFGIAKKEIIKGHNKDTAMAKNAYFILSPHYLLNLSIKLVKAFPKTNLNEEVNIEIICLSRTKACRAI